MEFNTIERTIECTLTRSAAYSLLAKSFEYPSEQCLNYITSDTYEETLRGFLALHPDDKNLRNHIDTFTSDRALLNARGSRDMLEAEYNRLFAHLGSAKCPPYETEFGHENVFQKTEAMADIAGFYSAYGLEPSATNTERVDFISMELEFMSYLALHEAYAREHEEAEHLDICVDTQRKFLAEHIGRWVSVFARILSNASSNAFYNWLGCFTEYFIDSEARHLEVVLEKVTGPAKMESQTPEPFGCEACITQEKLNEVTE